MGNGFCRQFGVAALMLTTGLFAGKAPAQTIVPASITTNTVWSPSGNPYQVTTNSVVASGVTLHVEPGVVVQLSEGIGLTVNGRMEALGLSSNTIQITRHPSAPFGGCIRLVGNTLALEATGIFDYCSFSALSNAIDTVNDVPFVSAAGVYANNASLTVSHSVLSNIMHHAIMALECRISITQNTFCHVWGGMTGLAAAGLISSNLIYDVIGSGDGVDFDTIWTGDGDPSIVVEWNDISGGPSQGCDGIDFDGGIPTIRFNIINDMEDCGITFGAGSQGDIHNNLIRNCRVGISIDDGASPVVMNNTFVQNGFGIRGRKRYFSTGGRGGVTNSIIWSCQTNIEQDAYSQITFGYCDIQGGVWPGTGNISVDPMFVNSASGDFRLSATSPCFNAGLLLPALIAETDLDKIPRLLDGSMDIGAYEYSRIIRVSVPSNTVEGTGVLTNAGLVLLATPQLTNTTVSLGSSLTQSLAVAGSVVVMAGQTSAVFDLTVNDDGVLNGGRNVVITGSGAGYRSGTGTVTVADNEVAMLGLQIPSSGSEGGANATGVVHITAVAGSPISVTLLSSHPTRLSVPATVQINAGATSSTFVVQTPENGYLDGAASALVTASVSGWSNAVAGMILTDNEPTNLMLTLVASVYEGDGVISPAGTVRIGGLAVSNVTVSLSSSVTNELTVPATVSILAGATSAVFAATLPDDVLPDGDTPVTITAAAPGLLPTNGMIIVRDNEVQRLDFSVIGATQTAGVPFAVTVQALTAQGSVMSNYSGQVSLTASNGSGPVSVSPPSVSVVSNGTWQGQVTVNEISTGIRLHVDDGVGSTGDSNPFDALAGTMHHFSVENSDTQRFAGKPFPISVTARDAGGNLVPNYSGSVLIGASVLGTTKTNLFLSNSSYNRSVPGTRTLGLRFYLATTVTVTHVRSYWGSKVSIWRDTGELLASKSVSGTSGQWTETALDTPLVLDGGNNYRIGVYGTNVTYYYRTLGTPLAFSNGVISEGCNTSADSFPGPTNSSRYLVDFRYVVNSNASVTLLPTNSSMFTLGAWTGDVVIAQQAPGVFIQASDSNGFVGLSTAFNVGTGHYITASAGANGTVSPSGQVGVVNGSNKTFTIQGDTGYQIATLTTNGVMITAATGKVSHVHVWSNVLAPGTLNATFVPSPVITNMQAFNDLGWQPGDVTANITTNSPAGLRSGSLKNFAAGQTLSANVNMSVAVGPVLINPFASMPLPPGSDAYNIFNGKVSCDNYSYWALGNVSIVFSNLVATQRYSFALFGSRGSASLTYSNRWVDVVISDVGDYQNHCSTGAGISKFTSAQAEDGTRSIGANVDGWVVKYDEILPGPDGDIVFTLSPGGNPGYGTNAYINAFMLAQTSSLSSASHMITVSFGNGGTISPTGVVSVADGANAAFTIQANPYWQVQTLATNGGTAGSMQGTAGGVYTWSNVVADGTLTASFVENLATNGVPEAWLASYGLTNTDFNVVALADPDGDGAASWEEYIAGTIPTSQTDCLLLNAMSSLSNASLSWRTATGRAYSVLAATGITTTWTNVAAPGYSNIPGTGGTISYTNTSPGNRSHYYRIKARLN